MKEGDLIVVWRDNGEALLTKARSDQFLDVNKNDVIFAIGVRGCYHCTHVRPVTIHKCVFSEDLKGEISLSKRIL